MRLRTHYRAAALCLGLVWVTLVALRVFADADERLPFLDPPTGTGSVKVECFVTPAPDGTALFVCAPHLPEDDATFHARIVWGTEA